MSFDGLPLLILAVAAAGIAAWVDYRKRKAKTATDEQLREWFAFITKSNGKPSLARLADADYESIRRLFHPGLKAEFEERMTRLENEYSARAIETALVIRRQAKGLPMSDTDDRILIREGLRKQTASQPSDSGVMEFTPGRKFDDPTTEDRTENEI